MPTILTVHVVKKTVYTMLWTETRRICDIRDTLAYFLREAKCGDVRS